MDGSKNFPKLQSPADIEIISGKIDDVFHWNRMKFTKAVVVLAVYYTIGEGKTAPEVVSSLWNIHRVKVSHDTITRWHHKAAFHLSAKTAALVKIPEKPGRKPRLYADETERKVRGRKRWFWMSYCRKHDLMLGRNLTERRSTKSARDLLSMTQALAPSLKAAELLTDGLKSYPAAMDDLEWSDEKHIRYLSFFESPNNNALERKWSNFHMRARPFRGFKSDVGQMAFIEGQIFYHNCLKPSVALGGQVTPYQHLQVPLPKHETPLELIAALLT
jgi:transposase-like protein